MGSTFSSGGDVLLNSSSPIVVSSAENSESRSRTLWFEPNQTESTASTNPIESTVSSAATMLNTTTHNSSDSVIGGSQFQVLENGTSMSDNKITVFGLTVLPIPWPTVPQLHSWFGILSSVAMIIGCVVPYIPQYITIKKNRNSSGFSTFVCLTLLIANISRVAFWYGHRFEIPLLIQAYLQIVTQILLLELCVRVSRQTPISRSKLNNFFNPRQFWRWKDLSSYLTFILAFSLLLGVAMYLFADCKLFVETVGYFALVTESMLGLPQVIKNYENKSTVGMSIMMVLFWLGGDVFKTFYYIANEVPFQFWLCGLSQVTIDLIILSQVALYRNRTPLKVNVKLSGDQSQKQMMTFS